MNIRPLYDRIVVKRIDEQESKTASGLFIPDSHAPSIAIAAHGLDSGMKVT